MTQLFSLIFITSLLVLGYTIASQEGMILYWIRQWASKKVYEGNRVMEALWTCHWCQPSIWSLLGFSFAFGIGIIDTLSWRLLFYYPLVVAGSSLFNGLIWGFHLRQEAARELDESVTNLTNECCDEEFQDEYFAQYGN